MATTTATIVIPCNVNSFATNVNPCDVDLEGRLDLSLDALIKERRKEHKLLKKQEEAKKQKLKLQTTVTRKTTKQQKHQQQKPKSSVKNGQKAQRKALVRKNRGLPTLSTAAKDSAMQGKVKTSIAATTAKLRRQIQANRTKNTNGRLILSSRMVKGASRRQQSQKKNLLQQTRKVASPVRVMQPKVGKKLQKLKQQPQTKSPVRQKMRSSSKAVKLNVTFTAKKKVQKKQNTHKVLLPGKSSQAFAKKTFAVVKRATSKKAKAAQVVRKVPGQRSRQ